ncbi:MAG: alkaline phosphatase D family protein [Flavobacteriales bacterium]|nr:alkaline phosphatase D family protein [Flavobacteriales bacterium]
MKRMILLAILLAFYSSLLAQLASGPMLGYVDLREACVWVQTETSAKVVLQYHPKDDPTQVETIPMTTSSPTFFTGKFILSGLEPGTTYRYIVTVDGQKNRKEGYEFTTQSLWHYRTDPPAFTVATGSCAYINEPEYDRPGKSYGGGYGIFDQIAGMEPDMMLWLGDNIYLREVDYGSRSGIAHRYTHTRGIPEMQKILSVCPNYAIWDDHDFGPNDSDRSYVHKDWTLEAFELFWGNPSFGIPGHPGITTSFAFNDVEFFLLDNRYHRSNYKLETAEHQIWGKEQVDWLIESLKFSKASFKVIATGGQFLSDAAIYENHAQYQKERDEVLRRLDAEGIRNVIFLTGDRHHTELSKVTLPEGNVVYDLTASPLTSRAYDHTDEPNNNRVEGTVVGEHNFAMLEFSGKFRERVCTIKVYDGDGELIWEKELSFDE